MAALTSRNGRIETAPESAPTLIRGLTRSLDSTKEGLAMDATRTCTVEECDRRRFGHGYCHMHYQRWRTHGSTDLPASRRTDAEAVLERMQQKVERRGDCLIWTGAKTAGRPSISIAGEKLYAHRYIYALAHGEPPAAVPIKARCGDSLCLNIEHLWIPALEPKPKCSVAGCDGTPASRGWCTKHYTRWRRHGDAEHRFVAPDPEPKLSSNGYVRLGGEWFHRVVLKEKIGDGTHACHWCKRPVTWGKRGANMLVVDHLDDDPTNNAPENLAPSCSACNTGRGIRAMRATQIARIHEANQQAQQEDEK